MSGTGANLFCVPSGPGAPGRALAGNTGISLFLSSQATRPLGAQRGTSKVILLRGDKCT